MKACGSGIEADPVECPADGRRGIGVAGRARGAGDGCFKRGPGAQVQRGAAFDPERDAGDARPQDQPPAATRCRKARGGTVRNQFQAELGEVGGAVVVEVTGCGLAKAAEIGGLPGIIHAVSVSVGIGTPDHAQDEVVHFREVGVVVQDAKSDGFANRRVARKNRVGAALAGADRGAGDCRGGERGDHAAIVIDERDGVGGIAQGMVPSEGEDIPYGHLVSGHVIGGVVPLEIGVPRACGGTAADLSTAVVFRSRWTTNGGSPNEPAIDIATGINVPVVNLRQAAANSGKELEAAVVVKRVDQNAGTGDGDRSAGGDQRIGTGGDFHVVLVSIAVGWPP